MANTTWALDPTHSELQFKVKHLMISTVSGQFNQFSGAVETEDDDFSTAKVLANMFELAPMINSIKDGHIATNAVTAENISLLQEQFKIYLEDIFGLTVATANNDGKLTGVMQLLIDIRKEAKLKKDYATSDKIRKQLTALGIDLKDEKDGAMSWTIG